MLNSVFKVFLNCPLKRAALNVSLLVCRHFICLCTYYTTYAFRILSRSAMNSAHPLAPSSIRPMVFHWNANILSDLLSYRKGGTQCRKCIFCIAMFFTIHAYLKFAFEQTITIIWITFAFRLWAYVWSTCLLNIKEMVRAVLLRSI